MQTVGSEKKNPQMDGWGKMQTVKVPHQTLPTRLLYVGELWGSGEVFSQLRPHFSRYQLPLRLQDTQCSWRRHKNIVGENTWLKCQLQIFWQKKKGLLMEGKHYFWCWCWGKYHECKQCLHWKSSFHLQLPRWPPSQTLGNKNSNKKIQTVGWAHKQTCIRL